MYWMMGRRVLDDGPPRVGGWAAAHWKMAHSVRSYGSFPWPYYAEVFGQSLGIGVGIGEHLEQHWAVCLACEERHDACLHALHVAGRHVAHVVLGADALCCGAVAGTDKAVGGRTRA